MGSDRIGKEMYEALGERMRKVIVKEIVEMYNKGNREKRREIH